MERSVAVGEAATKAKDGLVIGKNQRGNLVIRYINNVSYEYADVIPDYVMGQHCCALFLSLRYHLLHASYVYDRVKQLGSTLFKTRVLLVLVDMDDPAGPLVELSKLCMIAGLTLVCAASNREAGRYLETYRVFENKSTAEIQEHVEEDYESRRDAVLTAVRPVNKTDAKMLSANIGTIARIFTTDAASLRQVPGLGNKKVERLAKAFSLPFKKSDGGGGVVASSEGKAGGTSEATGGVPGPAA